MRIGILSDIHDHVWNLQAALHWMSGAQGEQGVEALICCGDLCSPFIVSLLAEGLPERPIHIVFGNNDGDLFRITASTAKHDQVHLHGELFEGELGGKRVAANHYPTIALPLAHSEQYDVVCFGHNHQYEITRLGPTLAINPGPIMGYNPVKKEAPKDVPATFVIYDTQTDAVEGYQVVTPWRSDDEPGSVVPFEPIPSPS